MRNLIILILCLWTGTAFTAQWEEQSLFKGSSGRQSLRIISSTDTAIFKPVISKFLAEHPQVDIEYLVAGSAYIYQEFRKSPAQYDIIISSAMDLQLKLVNDGFARRLEAIQHPDWAQWRKSLFGFTLEPASIVINRKAFSTLKIPQSRQDIIQILRENPNTFRGKIGTYDVRESGLGYLFATQDARASETYWRLMEIIGSLETKLYCCSGDMINDLAKGEIAISYNVLGSYALAREDLADKIEIIQPADFPNIMMRTAMVSKSSSQSRYADLFLRHLISSRWSNSTDSLASLPSIHSASNTTQRSIIALDPGLMIFLDRLKRKTFIKEWENAIIQ